MLCKADESTEFKVDSRKSPSSHFFSAVKLVRSTCGKSKFKLEAEDARAYASLKSDKLKIIKTK